MGRRAAYPRLSSAAEQDVMAGDSQKPARMWSLFIVILAVLALTVTHALAIDADLWTKAQAALNHKKYDEAIRLLTEPAASGDTLAQLALGTAYEHRGKDIADFESALLWYRRAADQGHPEAAVYAADMLHWGKGTPVNEEMAFSYYSKAASSENIDGMLGLAKMLEEGRGTQPDLNSAIQLYSKIADHSERAQYRLNGMVLTNDRTATDHAYSDALCYAYALEVLKVVDASRITAKKYPGSWVRVRHPPECAVTWEWKLSEWKRAQNYVRAWAAGLAAPESSGINPPASLPKALKVRVEGSDVSCVTLSKRASGSLKIKQQGSRLTLRSANGEETVGAIFGNRIVLVTKLLLEDHYSATEAGIVVAHGQWNGVAATLTNTLGNCNISMSK